MKFDSLNNTLLIDVYSTLLIACIVLFIGRFLVQKVGFLKKYTIPSPVAGGLLAAIGLLIAKQAFNLTVTFDLALQAPLMLAFFASIGLNANINSLKRGGKALFIFLFAVVGLLFIQNTIGVGLATLFDRSPLVGLIAGSITLSGGHGTGLAWGKTFTDEYGFMAANEVAMACATFGLVLGGLIGGPVARYLISTIKDKDIKGSEEQSTYNVDQMTAFEEPEKERPITANAILEVVAMMALCLTLGNFIAPILKSISPYLALPTFVCVLFVGVILNNSLTTFSSYKVFERSVSVMGNVSLSLFLAMALMSLKLWELASLAIPMIVILTVQTVVMATYAIFVTFRIMGKNYDAAVLAAGHCGFGMGATPTAIANMQAVTEKFGPSHIAFLIVPMVGAFFVDIANMIVLKLFLLLPMFTSLFTG